jgi:small subunit ribosomal protein S17
MQEVQPKRKLRKSRIGVVVSDVNEKTIVVKIERQVPHPIYRKYQKKSTKLMAHDEKNDAHIGDTVKIMETRPLSARKRWRLVEIVKRAK